MKVIEVSKKALKDSMNRAVEFCKEYPAVTGVYAGATLGKMVSNSPSAQEFYVASTVLLGTFLFVDIIRKSEKHSPKDDENLQSSQRADSRKSKTR